MKLSVTCRRRRVCFKFFLYFPVDGGYVFVISVMLRIVMIISRLWLLLMTTTVISPPTLSSPISNANFFHLCRIMQLNLHTQRIFKIHLSQARSQNELNTFSTLQQPTLSHFLTRRKEGTELTQLSTHSRQNQTHESRQRMKSRQKFMYHSINIFVYLVLGCQQNQ